MAEPRERAGLTEQPVAIRGRVGLGLDGLVEWEVGVMGCMGRRTVDGDEREVVDEHDEADGQGDERGHVGVLHGAGRVRAEEHRQDEEQGADHLPEEGLCWLIVKCWCGSSVRQLSVVVGGGTATGRRNPGKRTRDVTGIHTLIHTQGRETQHPPQPITYGLR